MCMLLVLIFQRASFHEGKGRFALWVFTSIKQGVCFSFHALPERFWRWIKLPTTALLLDTLTDLTRGKSALLAEIEVAFERAQALA